MDEDAATDTGRTHHRGGECRSILWQRFASEAIATSMKEGVIGIKYEKGVGLFIFIYLYLLFTRYS